MKLPYCLASDELSWRLLHHRIVGFIGEQRRFAHFTRPPYNWKYVHLSGETNCWIKEIHMSKYVCFLNTTFIHYLYIFVPWFYARDYSKLYI